MYSTNSVQGGLSNLVDGKAEQGRDEALVRVRAGIGFGRCVGQRQRKREEGRGTDKCKAEQGRLAPSPQGQVP